MDKTAIKIAYLEGKEHGVYDAIDIVLQGYDILIQRAKTRTLSDDEIKGLTYQIDLLNSLKETLSILLNIRTKKREDFEEQFDLSKIDETLESIYQEFRD